jgi:hypothetical protein
MAIRVEKYQTTMKTQANMTASRRKELGVSSKCCYYNPGTPCFAQQKVNSSSKAIEYVFHTWKDSKAERLSLRAQCGACKDKLAPTAIAVDKN